MCATVWICSFIVDSGICLLHSAQKVVVDDDELLSSAIGMLVAGSLLGDDADETMDLYRLAMSSPLDVEGGGNESDRVLSLLGTKATGRDNPVLNGGTVGGEEDGGVDVDRSMFVIEKRVQDHA